VVDEIAAGFQGAGADVVRSRHDLLTVNGEFTVSVVIVRARRTSCGNLRWRLRFDTGLRPDITVAVRMDTANRRPFDYYLFPRIDRLSAEVRMSEDNGLMLDAYRFCDLEALFQLGERAPVWEAA
jgi:hypothetical protein